MIYHTYRFRLLPTEDQIKKIDFNINSSRFIHNTFLKIQIQNKKTHGQHLSYNLLSSKLTELKRVPKYFWLKEADAVALQISGQMVHDKISKNPSFVSYIGKYDFNQNYTTQNNHNNLRVENNCLKLPKVGLVRMNMTQELTGDIYRVTITKDYLEHYYAAIVVKRQIQPLPKNEKSIGLIYGSDCFAVTSNGEKLNIAEDIEKLIKKLKREQRSLKRRREQAIVDGKPLGLAKNYQKQRIVVEKCYHKILNTRQDYTRKLVSSLVKNFDTIYIEKIDRKDYNRNHKFTKGMMDISWYNFVQTLKHKCELNNRKLIFVKIDEEFDEQKQIDRAKNIVITL